MSILPMQGAPYKTGAYTPPSPPPTTAPTSASPDITQNPSTPAPFPTRSWGGTGRKGYTGGFVPQPANLAARRMNRGQQLKMAKMQQQWMNAKKGVGMEQPMRGAPPNMQNPLIKHAGAAYQRRIPRHQLGRGPARRGFQGNLGNAYNAFLKKSVGPTPQDTFSIRDNGAIRSDLGNAARNEQRRLAMQRQQRSNRGRDIASRWARRRAALAGAMNAPTSGQAYSGSATAEPAVAAPSYDRIGF